MKKTYAIILFAFTLLSACKKDTDQTTCDAPYNVNFSLADKEVTVSIGYSLDGFDIEYGPAGFTQGSGTTASFSGSNTTSGSFTVSAYGSYDVYVRNRCEGNTSSWSGKNTVNVDGGYSSCGTPYSLTVYTSSTYQLQWYGSGNYYDMEYGPTGFTIGNGTRLRTNNTYTYDAIMHAGTTYDFYVRANCGGSTFSSWAGPHSVYAATDQNISTPCTAPTNLYAYKINWQEISYTSTGHGNTGYEIAFSTSASVNTGNILSTSSSNGTVGNPSGFNGTYYFWIRGRCDNGSFTSWSVSQVQ
ncbi:MAG: hypothetical protein U0T74_02175 [Chitinophagales bacterium]